MITPDFLAACLPDSHTGARVRFAPHLEAEMAVHEILGHRRVAAFLATVGEESGALRYVREIWGPTPAQQRYEGRADLGNVRPGDGRRYLGRGLIQATGRDMYRWLTAQRPGGPDFEAQPELLEEPQHAAWSACVIWTVSKRCNPLADALDFEACTRRINGGLTRYGDRCIRYARCLREAVRECPA